MKAMHLYKTLWIWCSHPDCSRTYSVDCYDKRAGIKELRKIGWAIYGNELAYCPKHKIRKPSGGNK